MLFLCNGIIIIVVFVVIFSNSVDKEHPFFFWSKQLFVKELRNLKHTHLKYPDECQQATLYLTLETIQHFLAKKLLLCIRHLTKKSLVITILCNLMP